MLTKSMEKFEKKEKRNVGFYPRVEQPEDDQQDDDDKIIYGYRFGLAFHGV